MNTHPIQEWSDTVTREAEEHALRALDLASRHRVPPVPKAFEVFFTYAGKANEALTARLDQEMRSHEMIPPQLIEQIHGEYLASHMVSDGVARIGHRMDAELADVIDLIETGMAESDAFASTIRRAQGRLSGRPDPRQAKEIVDRLMSESAEHAASISRFSDSVQSVRAQFTSMQHELRELRQSVLMDHMTQLPNRRRFDEVLEQRVREAGRRGGALSAIFVDIDFFKSFNERWGRATGDAVLRKEAEILRQHLRDGWTAARIEGDVFALILPDVPLQAAEGVAEQIRLATSRIQLIKSATREKVAGISCSAAATALRPREDSAALIGRLDDFILRAKAAGRDQVWSGG